MKIGELAKETGLNPKTIRFYEAEGLLSDPQRTPSGYRMYGPEDAGRLEFIRKAKHLGLSLEEVKGILQLHDRSEPTCVHVRSLLDEKLSQVERVLANLQGFQAELERLRDAAGDLEDCLPSGGRICGIIEQAGPVIRNETLAWIEPRPGTR